MLKRRDFITRIRNLFLGAAIAPAGLVGAEEKKQKDFVTTVEKGFVATAKTGCRLVFDNGPEGLEYYKAKEAFWDKAHGRKVRTVFHKDGLTVTFVIGS